ncbi:GDSL-like Lipase/Acylhydrolase [Colletotrichum gloeosporioides Cg-14]|uniref:GDSL-like Lipase/Acylhydrolase n=1 Tax=Colletotrichum gloeosporioides (strain Cg-14) TaxID=1237896 RepID=T0KUB3_COLGC|nr:GDSL-like Lipase/Acylhydrolase [Colletotrichum gloeosporioides Cg-14]
MRFSIASAVAFAAPLALAADSLNYTGAAAGQVIKDGVELRILPVGDSVTVGYLSTDGNGYRLKLQENLSANDVVFAGTESSGNMTDPYFAAWSGKTIQYIADNVPPSLTQRPNVILLHAGTNDMNPNPDISTEGNDPAAAAARLGALIDQMLEACPDATVLVAQIINTCVAEQQPQTEVFQGLIPDIVEQRQNASKHVLAVDFAALGDGILRSDCIHPSDEGYRTMGDYWYDFITQIPKDWITQPVGDDPDRSADAASAKNVTSSSGANAIFRENWMLILIAQALLTINVIYN